MTAWNALPEAERLAKQKEGIAAWKAWAEKHQSAIVGMGGPLGKTKKVSQRGIEDTSNEMGAYMVVRADSHEAAAELFERHPHFIDSTVIVMSPMRHAGNDASLFRCSHRGR
jgi:hypothetical protein